MDLLKEITAIDASLANYSDETLIDISKSNWMEQAAAQSVKYSALVEPHMVEIRRKLVDELNTSSGDNSCKENSFLVLTIKETHVVRLYINIPIDNIPQLKDDVVEFALFLSIWDGLINDSRDSLVYIQDLKIRYKNEQSFSRILYRVIETSKKKFPVELTNDNLVFQTYSS